MVEGYFLFVDLCCGLEKGRLVVGEVKFSGLKHARMKVIPFKPVMINKISSTSMKNVLLLILPT